MMPLPMVVATRVLIRAPVKLKKAARDTAAKGVRAWVDTLVAMAFAASWNPFEKSNSKATTTTTTSRASSSLGMPYDDILYNIRYILTFVDCRLHQPEEILPFDDLHRVVVVLEEFRYRLAVDPISLVFQRV